ncbi:MAG: methyltransferase domain-containing protein [Proteobacteria bacterium]|nr:methyltransferase domain-containing protein [Pseudomonadota bacterium]
MKDRQILLAERMSRQAHIDTRFVDPLWKGHVDVPLLEMSMAVPGQTPVILLPEMRFKGLMRMVAECFSNCGKFMVVDTVNTRFEMLRHALSKAEVSLYCSAQNLNALSYSDDVFSHLITELSLTTLLKFSMILPEYARVLRPSGRMVFAVPYWGTFPAFFDLLDESLCKLSPQEDDMTDIREAMSDARVRQVLGNNGLHVDGFEEVSFELSFPSVEELLFSTLVETNYLSYCLNYPVQYVEARQVLMLVVRAFHHYFQKDPVKVPFRMGLYSVTKAS